MAPGACRDSPGSRRRAHSSRRRGGSTSCSSAERAAFHSGLDVERLKRNAAVAIALAVGAVTAAAGPIGFIGLVAPHLARRSLGPRHAVLLPATVLLGIALVLAADLVVRLAVPPAEPPIGLATSLIGGPLFLWFLLRRRGAGHA